MRFKTTTARTLTLLVGLALTGDVAAGQTTQPKPRSTSGGTMVFVHVKNTAGRPLPDVRLQIDGATPGQFKTDIEGTIRLTAIKDGSYHLRFDKTGYSVMERIVTLHGGQPDVVDIVLVTELEKAQQPAPPSSATTPAATAATATAQAPSATTATPPPAATATPPPAATAKAASPRQAAASSAAANNSAAATSAKPSTPPSMAAASTAATATAALPATTSAPSPATTSAPLEERSVSITAFLDKNYIGNREPVKESLLGCTTTTRTRLLQLREGLSEHAHDGVDETLYVVAGEGAVAIANRPPVQVGPASLVVIPGGLPHAVQRRGKNPLIVLSTLSGLPCSDKVAATDQRQ